MPSEAVTDRIFTEAGLVAGLLFLAVIALCLFVRALMKSNEALNTENRQMLKDSILSNEKQTQAIVRLTDVMNAQSNALTASARSIT